MKSLILALMNYFYMTTPLQTCLAQFSSTSLTHFLACPRQNNIWMKVDKVITALLRISNIFSERIYLASLKGAELREAILIGTPKPLKQMTITWV